MSQNEAADRVKAIARAQNKLSEAVDDAGMSMTVYLHCEPDELNEFAKLFGVKPEIDRCEGKPYHVVRYGSIAIMD